MAGRYGLPTEAGGDLVCFLRGWPVYLNPHAKGPTDVRRFAGRVLCGELAADELRGKARIKRPGYSLPRLQSGTAR